MMSEKSSSSPVLVDIRNLHKQFPVSTSFFTREKKFVDALSGINLTIYKGETLGLVGESGCGKSTLGRCLLRLLEPTAGEIHYDGVNLSALSKREMRAYRKRIQVIFQDPYASLNPRMTVEDILKEPFQIHGMYKNPQDRKKRIENLLDMCGLRRETLTRYPHEFSGGQRQRVCIARALAVEPEFIVCDEPVSALDVSIQAQILNLMMQLQKDLHLTYLFISHDLKVVEHISDRVAVMYLGRIAELTSSEDLYQRPRHPYSQALLSAIPMTQPGMTRQRILLDGDVPSPVNPPQGCRFHPRCSYAQEICRQEVPQLTENRPVACHFPLY